MKHAFLTAIASVLLFGCTPAGMETSVPVTSTAAILPTATQTVSLPTSTATATAMPQATQLTECPAAGPGSSWERYQPGSLSELLEAVDQVSSPEQNPGISFYIETSDEYRFPSCRIMEYTGEYREIPAERRALIEAWSGIYGPEQQSQITQILQHEVLMKENGQEYWFVIQEPLIPYLEKEIADNGEVTLFTIWAGSSYLGEEPEHVFIINEFVKP